MVRPDLIGLRPWGVTVAKSSKAKPSRRWNKSKSAAPTRRVPVTGAEVARAAGLSQSVVSRTYTPGASVSAKTRAKVLAAAERLGYQPNAIARSLITRETNIVGVVMAQLANPFYHSVLEMLARRLQGLGRRVLLYM
ncbi:MAG: LacI family transcriptional regulator, partial [Lysobacterales bacterium]